MFFERFKRTLVERIYSFVVWTLLWMFGEQNFVDAAIIYTVTEIILHYVSVSRLTSCNSGLTFARISVQKVGEWGTRPLVEKSGGRRPPAFPPHYTHAVDDVDELSWQRYQLAIAKFSKSGVWDKVSEASTLFKIPKFS